MGIIITSITIGVSVGVIAYSLHLYLYKYFKKKDQDDDNKIFRYVKEEDLEKFMEWCESKGYSYKEVHWFEIDFKEEKR